MSDIVDIYSSINSWNTLYGHVTGVGSEDGNVADTAWALAGLGSDFVSMGQSLGVEIAEKLGNDASKAYGTPIIRAGLLAMMAMANTLGIGNPDNGDDFGRGAADFTKVGDALQTASIPDSWEGAAATAYGSRNDEQLDRARETADNDETVQGALAQEAAQVAATRQYIDRMSTTLTYSIIPALAALLIPVKGPLISKGIEIAAVAGTVPATGIRYRQMVQDGLQNATLMRRAGAGYDRVAASAAAAGGGSGGAGDRVAVDVADVTTLSAKQQMVATGIATAQQVTDGATAKVGLTHGMACAATVAGLGFAQTSRAAAAASMQAESTTLSGNLQTAATQYASTDAQQSSTLDQQVPPR